MLGLCALAGVLLAGVLSPAVIGAGVLSNQVSDSVDSISANLANTNVPLVTTITDKNGAPIAQLFDQYRLPVSFSQISPTMRAALIDIEDHRYYQEAGIDLKGALRAALNNSSGGSTQGASTITQQFVKNYLLNVVDRTDKAAHDADQAQTVARKLREAKMAMQLEQTMSKDNILTGYLNVVAFGPGATGPFGVGAAAKAYFGTTPDKLTVAQSALLAGMVNNPVSYDPYKHPQAALGRRNIVIDKMVEYNSLSAKDGAAAKKEPLGVVPGTGPVVPSSTCLGAAPDAGFFCNYAVSYLEQAGFTGSQLNTGGYTIKTTMDPAVSTAAKNAADNRVPTTQDGVANTFVVVQPGQTAHNVLAMVANRNYGNDATQGETTSNIDADVIDQFGGGSTYKLFTTASAMEQGKVGLNTILPNPDSTCFQLPIHNSRTPCYPVSNNDGTPQQIPLHQALADSPNTAFVGLELQDGMANVLNMAYRLGMRDTIQSNQHGETPITDPSNPLSKSILYSEPQSQSYLNSPSFTLGVGPLSPLEHANMGATLASGGMWCPPNPILSVTDRYGHPVPVTQQPCEQVINPNQANTMISGMSQDVISGTGAPAANAVHWTRPTAAKTGTTQNNESVGFLAIVDGYASSSLVFADGSHPAQICATNPPHLLQRGHSCAGGFGGTMAAPTFFDAFTQILAGQPDTPLPGPDPAFEDKGNHGPLVPFVIGQQEAAAAGTLQGAGYVVSAKEFNSNTPRGTVIGQTPQSNQATGTTVTLYVSTGVLPAPPNPQPSPTSAPGSTTG